MTYFSYRGRNSAGGLVQGFAEGVDSGAVATQLFGSGITPVEIAAARKPTANRTIGLLTRFTGRRIEPAEMLLFSRQMYALLKAGVPIMRALAGLQESATNPTFEAVLLEIRESLDSGRPLSASMQRTGVFSPFYIAMVFVGETTGMLEEIFLRLYNHLEFQEFMRNQVKSALRYPTFVIIAMAVAIVIINLFVIPAFAKVYAGFNAQLPLLTRLLIGFSDFMVATWWLQAVILVVAVFAFRSYIATQHGRYRWDKAKLGLPVAGNIVLKATMARFARSFSLSIRSGVPVIQALTLVAQTVDNAYVAKQIEGMRDGVERGESILRTATNAAIFTPVVLQMVMVGEESGALDDMMQEIAEIYQREVEYELKTLGAQIEPILIVSLGVVVLILALGVFLPIWDLGQAAMRK